VGVPGQSSRCFSVVARNCPPLPHRHSDSFARDPNQQIFEAIVTSLCLRRCGTAAYSSTTLGVTQVFLAAGCKLVRAIVLDASACISEASAMLTHSIRPLPLLAALATCLCVLASPKEGFASGSPLGNCWACGLWLPAGVNLGAGIHPNYGTNFLIGGEVSVIDLRRNAQNHLPFGAYADFLRDQSVKTWRLSAGPELLIAPFVGMDAGLVVEMGAPTPRLGMRVRYFAASFLLTPYLGSDLLFTGENRWVMEAGVLLKYPILLAGG